MIPQSIPEKVIEARDAYREVRRQHGLCQRITCFRKSAPDRVCCAVCLARTAKFSREYERKKALKR